jgi:redox-sensing transcriptional repressor
LDFAALKRTRGRSRLSVLKKTVRSPVPARQPEPAALSRAAAARFSQYLRCLPAGGGTVSSSTLARAVGVSDAQVRRDLAALGHLGQRGVGYDAEALGDALRKKLGIDRTWRTVIVGAGNLARALLRYRGFRTQGFEIVGLFDSDPSKLGQPIEGLTVESAQRIGPRVKELRAELGVVAVPSDAAQAVAERLVQAGVKGLLNFAPILLRTPPEVRIVAVDLAIQFEQLAYLVAEGEAVEDPPAGVATRRRGR